MLPVVSGRNSHLLRVLAPGILMFLDASGRFWLETFCASAFLRWLWRTSDSSWMWSVVGEAWMTHSAGADVKNEKPCYGSKFYLHGCHKKELLARKTALKKVQPCINHVERQKPSDHMHNPWHLSLSLYIYDTSKFSMRDLDADFKRIKGLCG